ncbi:MAG: hypothetical protein AB1442_05390 [Nitrospirota bacterium]
MKKIILVVITLNLSLMLASSLPCYAGRGHDWHGGGSHQPPVDVSDVIHACYKTMNGQLRIVNGPDDCRPSEAYISWNEGSDMGLSGTSVVTCTDTSDCQCDNGLALSGYAECPANAALASAGSPIDASDSGFHATCVSLADGSIVNPVSISVRCIAVPVEANCSDGIDDDGDTLIDCADSDCSADPACQPVAIETNCSDGIDDDGDGAIDCADSDCAADPLCQPVATETNCSDGIDDDGDGLIDCADSDCAADPLCQPVATETDCSDESDNDGDGAIDCADSDCAADAACSVSSKPGKGKKKKPH